MHVKVILDPGKLRVIKILPRLKIQRQNSALQRHKLRYWPFNSQNPFCSRSFLKYQYTILQTANEGTDTYQAEVFILIQHQILSTYFRGNV